MSLKALGEGLVCETGSPSRLVSTLVERGWIERKEDEADRRRITLSLTEEGQRLAEAVSQVEARLYRWIDQRIDTDTMEQLLEGLRALLDGTAAGQAITRRKSGQ